MSKPIHTQCPNCHSLFEVTKEQLDRANGSVRCGNCLSVFQANDYLQDPGSHTPVLNDAVNDISSHGEKQHSEVDESWALELLKELEDEDDDDLSSISDTSSTLKKIISEPVQPGTVNETIETPASDTLSDSLQEIDDCSQDITPDYFGEIGNEEAESNLDTDDEAWAKELLQSSEKETNNSQPKQARTGKSNKRAVASSVRQKKTSNTDTNPRDRELSAFEENQLFADTDAKNIVATMKLEPVPLNLNEGSTKHLTRRLIELLPSLFLSLLLCGQYLFHNMDTLAKRSDLRPWYEKACAILGCNLPAQSDISRIRGTNLTLRSHPEASNALLVDTIITNHTNFDQPFPLLELTFSDLNGFPVASRRFTPDEYLSGALTKLTLMPSRLPLHINLSILDPGKAAVNYHVTFYEMH